MYIQYMFNFKNYAKKAQMQKKALMQKKAHVDLVPKVLGHFNFLSIF